MRRLLGESEHTTIMIYMMTMYNDRKVDDLNIIMEEYPSMKRRVDKALAYYMPLKTKINYDKDCDLFIEKESEK